MSDVLNGYCLRLHYSAFIVLRDEGSGRECRHARHFRMIEHKSVCPVHVMIFRLFVIANKLGRT
jgi:hypothetical protein